MSRQRPIWLFMWLFALIVAVAMPPAAAQAQTGWADELANSLSFYQANYPASNWAPYVQKLNLVREALSRGDQRTVRVEMNKWFKMLRNREHGIHDVAADELFNFAVMVTPLQEYGISVSPIGLGQ
ncbi:hypothetical protein [Candidatus Nitrospira bockiana]